MVDKPIGNMKFGIGVDGIDKTISSLDELQRKIKQAESSMKANAKAFDDGGKSIDSMGQKTKDLTSLMGLEENKMKILETRREKAIETYGKESKQVDKLNTEINKSIAKYNGYGSQLGKVTTALDKQLVSSSKYGTQIEANNKIMEREIVIAKKSGNEVDIVKAKQKAYAANLEVTKQAVINQTKEVDRLTKEYGDSSSEVEKAKRQLTAYSNTSKDTKQELTKLDKELTVAEKSMKGMSTESKGASREGVKLDGVMGQLEKTVSGVQGSFSKGFSGITSSIGKATNGVGIFVGAGALGAVASVGAKAFGLVTSSVDAAIKRIDTLNNSTRAFENMGFNPKQITKGMDDLQAATKGLPTSLSDAVSNVQLLAASTDDMDLSVGVFKAMNDAILGFGGDVNMVDNAVVQLSQAFSNGKIDGQTWNSMINSGLGPTLNALAKQMDITTGELKKGLSKGDISVKEFQEALIDLDKNGGGGLKSLEQIAKDSSKGIGTSLANMKTAIVRGTANLIEGIDKSLKNMGLPTIDEWIVTVGETFEKSLGAIGKGIPELAKRFSFIGDLFVGLNTTVTGIVKVFKILVDYFQTMLWPILEPIIVSIVDGITEIFETLNDWWTTSGSRILEAIKNFLVLLTPLFKVAGMIVAGFVDNVIGLVKGMVSVLTGIIDVFSMIFTGDFAGMWDAIKRIFFGAIQVIWNGVQLLLFGKLLKGVKGLTSGFTGSIKAMWEGVKKFFTSGIGDAIGQVTGWITKLLGSGNTLKSSFTNIIKGLWDGIKTVFSGGIDTVVKWMTDLPSQMGKAISKGASYVTKAFKGIFNGALKAIGGPVNGIIGGANWVLKKFGAKPIAKWEVPKYADGTDGHPGGMMMVNDGRGAEIVERPNGEMFIPQGKNVTMYGERGTKVYTAEETAMALGHKRPKYRYKKGTGQSLFDKIGGAVGDVWDFIKSPFDLAKKALTNAVDFTGISHVPLDMAKGLLNTSIKAFGNTVKKMFDDDFSTKIGSNGVYQYLENIAKHLIGKFGGLRVTSGYREGDPYSHGSRNAIDVAFPASMNGSSKNTEVADYAFNEFKKKIGYVITNGRVRDREGTSGTGIHDGWANWPDNDHYDHIHLNGIKRFMGESKQGTGLMSSGSGVARWRSTAAQALYMTGQYSKSNLDKLMYQMQTESNGDPRAINNWDSNAVAGTPSKGLMQVIDPTFRSYAMRGYNSNIYDPLSNILASIRYAMSRYGSLSAAYRGTGYKNGGVVTQAGMYDLVENGYPEIVIPTEPAKRGRAMMLLNQAKTMLGVKDNKKTSTSETTNSDMTMLLSLMIEQNKLLKSILDKDSDTYLNGRKVNDELSNINNTTIRNRNRDLGLV